MSDDNIIQVGVRLEGEDINDYLAKAVLESALGEQVRKAVGEAVKRLNTSYYGQDGLRSAIDSEVFQMAQRMARELVSDELNEKVRTIVMNYLTDDRLGELVQKAMQGEKVRY
jgi:hypothetical protein